MIEWIDPILTVVSSYEGPDIYGKLSIATSTHPSILVLVFLRPMCIKTLFELGHAWLTIYVTHVCFHPSSIDIILLLKMGIMIPALSDPWTFDHLQPSHHIETD